MCVESGECIVRRVIVCVCVEWRVCSEESDCVCVGGGR